MTTRRNRTTALPDVTSNAVPVIVLDDDDTPPEHVFEQFEPKQGVWNEFAEDVSAHDTEVAATTPSSTHSIPVSAPVTSVVTLNAPLLVVTSAPSTALPSRVTLVTTATITSALASAATTIVFAVASTSRELIRSPSPNRPD